MSQRICFDLNGQRHCIDIPILVQRPWPPEPPLKDRWYVPNWIITMGPHPEPWGPSPDPWATDLSIIQTIDTMIVQLRDESIREQMTNVVGEIRSQVARQLPQGFELEIREDQLAADHG